MKSLVISLGELSSETLKGRLAVVSGAGGGIGFEAARSLAWLGAHVVVAEVNKQAGKEAAQKINAEMGASCATFIHTNVGDERSVLRLARRLAKQGTVDIVLNNATVTPIGPVTDIPPSEWDRSYAVNLRGPVLLARAFLPGMLQQKKGVFVSVSSSGAAPYMGAYEVFKTAQGELANTLAAELEETGVFAFTIGPGLVPGTPGASKAIAKVSAFLGQTVAEFNAMSQNQILSVEAAGAGFAAAVAMAERFHGQEIGSIQALQAAGIPLQQGQKEEVSFELTAAEAGAAAQVCQSIRQTLAEQSAGWVERPLFERQWMIRDFRKNAGMPVEQWLHTLGQLEERLAAADTPGALDLKAPLVQLARYYAHLKEQAKGYEKDPEKLASHLKIISGWEDEVKQLMEYLHQQK